MTDARPHCRRCGYVWQSRISGRPKQCPSCKRMDWDKPEVRRYGTPSPAKTDWDKLTDEHPPDCPCTLCWVARELE